MHLLQLVSAVRLYREHLMVKGNCLLTGWLRLLTDVQNCNVRHWLDWRCPIVFQYISNKMQLYTVYIHLETALRVSGGISTHHQERIQLYLQHLVFVTPLLLPADIAAGSSDGVDTVVCAADDGWEYHPKHVEQFPDINKLYNVASCWMYTGILLGAHPILHVSRKSVNNCLSLHIARLIIMQFPSDCSLCLPSRCQHPVLTIETPMLTWRTY
jgi:hypothetical protein